MKCSGVHVPRNVFHNQNFEFHSFYPCFLDRHLNIVANHLFCILIVYFFFIYIIGIQKKHFPLLTIS
jgi:hypothetical protein